MGLVGMGASVSMEESGFAFLRCPFKCPVFLQAQNARALSFCCRAAESGELKAEGWLPGESRAGDDTPQSGGSAG